MRVGINRESGLRPLSRRERSCPRLANVLADPGGKRGFVDRVPRKGQDHGRGFAFGSGKRQGVAVEKHVGGHEAGAFVAVDEGVVGDDACGIRRGEGRKIGGLVGMEIPGTGQGGIEEALVAQSRGPAKFRQ
jgi:hypothetical protein